MGAGTEITLIWKGALTPEWKAWFHNFIFQPRASAFFPHLSFLIYKVKAMSATFCSSSVTMKGVSRRLGPVQGLCLSRLIVLCSAMQGFCCADGSGGPFPHLTPLGRTGFISVRSGRRPGIV